MVISQYKVGGSLQNNDPTYVERQSDKELYTALLNGEFCYVFNTRQMGKSSLLVKAKQKLEQEGYRCTNVDITRIGSKHITPLQWYKGTVGDLWRGFGCLGKINLKTWWQEKEEISLLQRLSEFIEELLLNQFPDQKLCIFIDEIDNILSLEFDVDDFFALIRYCYNQRAINPAYNRITFALFGVATPSDLIRDKTKTPFNIGKAIELHGFSIEEALPLTKGLVGLVERPQTILKEILAWTSGQPFLTQKVCKLVELAAREMQSPMPQGREAFWVENIVKSRVIDSWEFQDEPEHLKTIRTRILHNQNRAGRLLGIYQQILIGVKIPTDHSFEQIQLLLSGLIIKQHSFLEVKNRIYAEVFDLEWVKTQLRQLRPYSQAFDAWIASSQTDSSRLLRGQALIEALSWSQGKGLSDLDYRFLADSTELDRREVQLVLEAERTREVEARLAQEKKAAKRQKLLLFATTIAFVLACAFGVSAYFENHKALLSEYQARVSEIRALVSSSEGLFASNRRLDALVEAIKATRRQQKINNIDKNIDLQVKNALGQAVYGADEYNRLSGHTAAVLAVAISPDSSTIASASTDNTVKVWKSDGSLLTTLIGHKAAVRQVNFSSNGQTIVSASEDLTIKIWKRDGTLLKTLTGHKMPIWVAKFSPDGQQIVSVSVDNNIKLWKPDGTLIKTLTGRGGEALGVAFSPDSQIFVTAGLDNTLSFWRRDGQLLRTIPTDSRASCVTFNPQGNMIASSSIDNTVKVWSLDGKLLKTYSGHTGIITKIVFSPDGQRIASSSQDKTIKLWHIDGSELATFRGHSVTVWGLAWSRDGSFIASAGAENVVKLWQSQNPLQTTITAHKSGMYSVDISSDSTTIATGGSSTDSTVKLWDRTGKLLATFVGHKAPVLYVDISPNGKLIASASTDSTVKLWRRDGTLVRTFNDFKAIVISVAFSPQGNILASSSQDGTVKLWKLDGTLIKTLKGGSASPWRLAFSPDGTRIAVGSGDGTIKVWKLDGTLERSFQAHSTTVWIVAFSPDGQSLASGSADGTVKLWKLDGTKLKTFTGHRAAVWGISFSPQGNIIASGSVDNMVKLWKLDGTEIATLRGHSSAVRGVSFSQDGTFLATVGEDSKLIMWNLPRILKLNLQAEACSRVGDYLRTNAEVEEKSCN